MFHHFSWSKSTLFCLFQRWGQLLPHLLAESGQGHVRSLVHQEPQRRRQGEEDGRDLTRFVRSELSAGLFFGNLFFQLFNENLSEKSDKLKMIDRQCVNDSSF